MSSIIGYLAFLVAVLVLAVESRSPPYRDLCWNHKCRRGYYCKVIQPQCIRAPCPSGVPVCVKRQRPNKEGRCPRYNLWGRSTRRCGRRCRRDRDCPGVMKCCRWRGCGKMCMRPRRRYNWFYDLFGSDD